MKNRLAVPAEASSMVGTGGAAFAFWGIANIGC